MGQGDGMKEGPPRKIETLVAMLVPPARREEVLGDLRERYANPRQYVTDAIRTVPLVVASQIRRTTDLGVLFLEAFALYFCFFAGTLRLHLGGAPLMLEEPRALSILIPTAIALAALRFVDAYSNGRKRSTLKLILGTATAVSFAFLSEAALSLARFDMAISSSALFRGGAFAVALLSMLRTAFPSGANSFRTTAAAGTEQATPLEAIRRSSAEFETGIRRRNLREYIAAGVVLGIFSMNLVTTHIAGARVGFAFIIAGILYVLYQLYTRGSAKSVPASTSFAGHVDFYRQELERRSQTLVGAALVGGVFFVVARLNQKGARRLQRKIDELGRIGPQDS
jgi:hypothetical protein